MRKRFDSIVQSSIELEKWDVIRDKLKNDNDGYVFLNTIFTTNSKTRFYN